MAHKVYGYADCLVLLLNNGAQVNCEDEGGATPLHFAVSTNLNHVDEGYGNRLKSDITIECLLNYGASVTSADNDGRVPLHWAANADNASACEIMVSRGCPVNTTCNDGLTALHIAASRGYTECMRVLVINCYADVNISDKTGHTPLLYALIMEHIDCAELLMCDGALPNTCNTGGLSPAHHAASKGLTSALEILHKYEGSLELVDAEGDRPLHKAAYHGQLDAVDYMLKCKCKVNVRNKEGFTPLHLAASVGAVPVCDRLLAGGACLNDIVMKDENGERQFVTALDLAHLNEHTDCLQFLTNEGAMCGQRVANFAATKIQKCWRRKHVFCRASRDTEGEEHKETSSDELSTGTDSQSAKIKEDRDERVQVKTTEQHESTTSGGSLSSLNEGRNVKAVQQHVDSSTACSTVSEDLPTETLNKDKDIEAIRELREDKGCANTGRGADEEIIDCTETSSKTNESRSMVSTDTTSDTPCEKNEQFTEENQSDNHRSVTLDNHAMVRGTSTYEKHNTSLGPGVGPTVNLRKAERQRSKVCERPREQKKLLQTRQTRNSKLIKCKGMRLPRTVDADNVIANPKSQVKLRRVKSDNDKAQPKQQLRQSSEEQSLQVERNLNDASEAELSRTEELSRELERIKKNLNVRTRSLEQGLKEVEQKLRWT